jgi:hypothetical protein
MVYNVLMKLAMRLYKTLTKRFGRYLPVLFCFGVVLFLRQMWALKHECVPIATRKIAFEGNNSSFEPAFSLDSKTFAVVSNGRFYLFETESLNLIGQWSCQSATRITSPSKNPEEWILEFREGDVKTKGIFSTKEGRVIETIGNLSETTLIRASDEGRFIVGYLDSTTDKKATYQVYDRKTKKQQPLPGVEIGYRWQFWPNNETICVQYIDKPVALYDAHAGKPAIFPQRLQSRAKEIMAINRYGNHHAIVFADGTIQYYTSDNFENPTHTFKIKENCNQFNLYFHIGKPSYLYVSYLIKYDKNKNFYNSEYAEVSEFFSLDTGKTLARFLSTPRNIQNTQEYAEQIGGENVLVRQYNYQEISGSTMNGTPRVKTINHRYIFHHLPEGNRFGFQTRPLWSPQGISIPKIPDLYSGRFSYSGRFYISAHQVQDFSTARYNSPYKTEFAVTMWKLPQ